MNPDNIRRPALYRGERYNQAIAKGGGGNQKDPEVSYDDARARIISDIEATKNAIREMPSNLRLPHEFIVSVRIDPGFSAKSYYPSTLFDSVQRSVGTQEIGSRIWRNSDNEEVGKMFFVRTTEEGLSKLEEKLNSPESGVTKSFALDVRKVKSLDLLSPDEQVLGIPEDWKEGRLEFVLHPFGEDNSLVLEHFLKLVAGAGVDITDIKSKQYESGVTFVSLYGNRDVLKQIAGYNPLRMVHPLSFRKMPVTRVAIKASAPKPPEEKEKASVVMGIFDGGLQVDNPYTAPYCESVDLVTSPPDDGDVLHGTMVAGAALYGAINDYGKNDTLPSPLVTVRSFRICPTEDNDQDLYEVIDAIEKVVPEQKDIAVYNLSIGPYGPILDDHISRFTFACDLLAAKHNVLFCTAVGNSGDEDVEYLRRIQSPSDMVNGLGVGAYSTVKGKIIRAPYSCFGPGREGNKLKPDISAFGGCDQSPIHLISVDANCKDATQGTSFASPIVASKAAQLIGYSNKAITPLVARAMLIHTARSVNDSDAHNNELGHGLLAETVEDIVTCKSNSFTLIYQGELEFGKYTEFKIPWINGIKTGKARFKWTSVVLTGIDPHSPDDYTTGSTVVTFYPHSNKYKYLKEGKSKTLDLNTEIAAAGALEADGWKKSPFPASASGTKAYANEGELRADMKWDTVDCKSDGKMTEGVFDPIFHIHALSRGSRYISRKIRFALVVTVELNDETIDLYSQIVSNFNLLVPLSININNQIQINNG